MSSPHLPSKHLLLAVSNLTQPPNTKPNERPAVAHILRDLRDEVRGMAGQGLAGLTQNPLTGLEFPFDPLLLWMWGCS